MVFNNNVNFTYSVVIPMFNEEKIATECINKVYEVIDKTEPNGKLVVVDDGSSDNTAQILNKLNKEYSSLRIIINSNNLGYGGSLYKGLEYAISQKDKYVVFMDSDLTNNPKDLFQFVEKMKKNYDYIKASRYGLNAGTSGVPLFRKFISYIGKLIVHLFLKTKIVDVTNGFRAIKVDKILNFKPTETGFPIIMEEMCYLNNLTQNVTNVPIILKNRNSDQGSSSFRYSFKMFYKYLKYPILSAIKNMIGK